MSNYIQKPFDKAFSKVIEDLYNNRTTHGKFTKRKELLGSLGILPTNYTAIRSGERGVPMDRYEEISKKLKEHYFVNPEYLYGRSPLMYLRNVRPSTGGDGSNTNEKDLLAAELMNANNLLEEKERFIQFQQQTIEMLSKQVEKLQDILAGKSTNTRN